MSETCDIDAPTRPNTPPAADPRFPASAEEDWFRPCALVLVRGHARGLAALIEMLRAEDLPCVLVAADASPATIRLIEAQATDVALHPLRQRVPEDKGAALRDGLREAARLGYSHALQVDADGQYTTDTLGLFLDRACQAPDALICGYLYHEAEALSARRRLTCHQARAWTWLNTLSTSIRDALGNLRVYPLIPTLPLLDRMPPGRHRDFDSEILVRLNWQDQPIVWLATRVKQPMEDASSCTWRDNLLIASTQARLFFGMLRRAPLLLRRKLRA